MKEQDNGPMAYLIIILMILVSTPVLSRDRFTWILEVFPILIGLPVLILTRRNFQLTDLIYSLIVLHSLILSEGSGSLSFSPTPVRRR